MQTGPGGWATRTGGRRPRAGVVGAAGAVALLGGLAAPASAGKGGQPPARSCGIGRAEARFLRQLLVRPGAGEAALLDPHDPKQACAGQG